MRLWDSFIPSILIISLFINIAGAQELNFKIQNDFEAISKMSLSQEDFEMATGLNSNFYEYRNLKRKLKNNNAKVDIDIMDRNKFEPVVRDKDLTHLKDDAKIKKLLRDLGNLPMQIVPPIDPMEDFNKKIQRNVNAFSKKDFLDSKLCDEAANRLIKLQSKLPNDPVDSTVYIDAVRNYDKHCLSQIKDLPQYLINNGILDIVGIIVDNSGEPFCGAFRIEKNLIATARHCFFDKITNHPLRTFNACFFILLSDLKDLNKKYKLLRENQNSFFIGKNDKEITIPSKEDYHFFYTDNIEKSLPNINYSSPNTGDKLILIGFNTTVAKSQNITRLANFNIEGTYYDKAIRWSTQPSCAVFYQKAECIYYACQCEQGYSGLPIFIMRESSKEMEICGVHISPGSGAGGCSDRPSLNAGISFRFPISPQ